MTRAGAEPSEQRENALDYEHYVQKQIRPVAESVGHEAERVAGAARTRVEAVVERAGDAAVDAITDDTPGAGPGEASDVAAAN